MSTILLLIRSVSCYLIGLAFLEVLKIPFYFFWEFENVGQPCPVFPFNNFQTNVAPAAIFNLSSPMWLILHVATSLIYIVVAKLCDPLGRRPKTFEIHLGAMILFASPILMHMDYLTTAFQPPKHNPTLVNIGVLLLVLALHMIGMMILAVFKDQTAQFKRPVNHGITFSEWCSVTIMERFKKIHPSDIPTAAQYLTWWTIVDFLHSLVLAAPAVVQMIGFFSTLFMQITDLIVNKNHFKIVYVMCQCGWLISSVFTTIDLLTQ